MLLAVGAIDDEGERTGTHCARRSIPSETRSVRRWYGGGDSDATTPRPSTAPASPPMHSLSSAALTKRQRCGNGTALQAFRIRRPQAVVAMSKDQQTRRLPEIEPQPLQGPSSGLGPLRTSQHAPGTAILSASVDYSCQRQNLFRNN
jgi:hypothetical protein